MPYYMNVNANMMYKKHKQKTQINPNTNIFTPSAHIFKREE